MSECLNCLCKPCECTTNMKDDNPLRWNIESALVELVESSELHPDWKANAQKFLLEALRLMREE